MGITKNQVSVLLSSKVNPFKSNYLKLCNVLGVEPISLLQGSNKESGEEKKFTNMKREERYIDCSTVKAERRYRSVELFAGAGELTLGLEKTGFDELALVEVDKYDAGFLWIYRFLLGAYG